MGTELDRHKPSPKRPLRSLRFAGNDALKVKARSTLRNPLIYSLTLNLSSETELDRHKPSPKRPLSSLRFVGNDALKVKARSTLQNLLIYSPTLTLN